MTNRSDNPIPLPVIDLPGTWRWKVKSTCIPNFFYLCLQDKYMGIWFTQGREPFHHGSRDSLDSGARKAAILLHNASNVSPDITGTYQPKG